MSFHVKLRKDETQENLIKRFLKKTKKQKIIDEVLDRRFYKSPSQIKREKRKKQTLHKERTENKEKQTKKSEKNLNTRNDSSN